MNELLLLLGTEARKLRRTLALGLAVVAPAMVVGLYFLYLLTLRPGRWPQDGQAWLAFTRMCVGLWSFLMLPLYIALQTALLNGVEHGNHQWKHLFAMPVARWRVYLAKLIASSVLVALSFALLFLLLLPAGAVAQALRPWMGFGGVPAAGMAALVFKPFGASAILLAAHHLISSRTGSMTLALGTGVAGTVAAFVVVNSARWGRFFPWAMPMRVASGMDPMAGLIMTVSILGAVLLTALGCILVERREPI